MSAVRSLDCLEPVRKGVSEEQGRGGMGSELGGKAYVARAASMGALGEG